MRRPGYAPAAIEVRRSFAGIGRNARTTVAASISTLVLLLDLVSFSQLIFAGPLEQSRSLGFSAMLLAYVLGSLVFAAIHRSVPVTLSFIGAAIVVQAAIAASVAERLGALGITDPVLIGESVLLACGIATFTTGVIFTLLGTLRASLLAQLLPYPVLIGFLAGVGLLLLQGGLEIGARVAEPFAAMWTTTEPGFPGRIGLTLLIGAAAFYLPRRLGHWAVYPAVILGTFVVAHAALWLSGISMSEAQALGWLLDPLPTGSLVHMPAAQGIGLLDPGLLAPLVPKIITQALVAVIVQILYVMSVELEMQRDLELDKMFVASGSANLLGGLFGSPAMGLGRTSTMLLHSIGGGNWLGWSLTIGLMIALLLLGAGPLALIPRPLAGGALIALGLNLVVILVLGTRTISPWEIAVAVAVCLATAMLGAAPGFFVGIVLAIVIFAVQYARIPTVRLAFTGAERPSSVIRAPETGRTLREAGNGTVVYALQGFLFFLNAQALHRRATAEPELRRLVLDFRDCVGLDSSALVAFRKVAQEAERRGFDLLLVELEPATRRQIVRSGLADRPRVQVLDTLDEALQWAEAALLAEAGIVGEPAATTIGQQIARALGCPIAPDELAPYTTTRTLAAGDVLLRQGDPADALYFVESGIVSIELEVAGRPNLRLRTTTAGTVIGEVTMLQGGRRTATAVAQGPCRVVGLDLTALARMERERPGLALHVQRFLILEIAGKLADTNRLLEAALR